MDLKDYFETRQGTGVLATADAQGNVDAALYSRPHVMDDGTVAFIM
ncbi:MAG TPA: pyridoxamine 5'-phosphate oxidase family protein, partial [Spirochaetota bacterium]|nr:pyridoxamine 5'-phosphate oxidase family protein [Spirochaetota bacterium]